MGPEGPVVSWHVPYDGLWSTTGNDWSDGYNPDYALDQSVIIDSGTAGNVVVVVINTTLGDYSSTATAANNLTIGSYNVLDIIAGGSLTVYGTTDVSGLIEVDGTVW